MIRKERLPFVFLAVLCLLTGLLAGLVRIGWNLQIGNAVTHHGAIMVGGFLGTLISLEKIIPLKKPYLYLIPLCSALSVALLLMGKHFEGMIMLTLASSAMVLVVGAYLVMFGSAVYSIMLAGAVSWMVGNVTLWTTNFYPAALPWWMGFALFIIASERLELMKFLPVSKYTHAIIGFLAFSFALGCILSFHGTGGYISAAALIAIAIWFLRFDVIRILMEKPGQSRFTAISLLCGYFSLLLTGVFVMIGVSQLYFYDIIVHLFFIGFVFSMIFAHGPIILPGVLGVSIRPFGWPLYIWLFILHASLIARVAGDAFMLVEVRKYSAVLTSVAIVGYFITIVFLMVRRRTNERSL